MSEKPDTIQTEGFGDPTTVNVFADLTLKGHVLSGRHSRRQPNGLSHADSVGAKDKGQQVYSYMVGDADVPSLRGASKGRDTVADTYTYQVVDITIR